METLLLLIGIGIVALLLVRSKPPVQNTVFVPVPVPVTEPRGGLGCLPLIVVGFLVLLVAGLI